MGRHCCIPGRERRVNQAKWRNDCVEQATTVFLAGIFGVFVGMTLIYIAIRITSLIVDYIGTDKESP